MAIRVALHHTSATATTARSRWRRTSCACGRRRTAARRSSATRCASSPSEHFLNWQQDPFGNYQARLVFPQPARELTRRGRPDRRAGRRSTRSTSSSRSTPRSYPFAYEPALARELAPYLRAVADRAALRARWSTSCATACRAPGRRSVDVLVDINQRGAAARCATTSAWSRACSTPEETLERGHGSCRDFAWLVVQRAAPARLRRALRVGLLDPAQGRPEAARRPGGRQRGRHRPARLGRGLPAGRGLDRPRRHQRPAGGRGAHPARLHGRSPATAAPITGSYSPGTGAPRTTSVGEEFALRDAGARASTRPPRVTKPYREEQWEAIQALRRRRSTAISNGWTCA